jgi:hypothetical protein
MLKSEIKNTLKMCRFCYMCRHSCPVFLTTKLDTNTPRGYALLLSRFDEGLTGMSDTLINKLYECTQCGLCKEICEFHWDEDEVVRSGREYAVEQGRAPQNVKDALAVIDAKYALPVGNKAIVERKGAGVLYYGGREAAQNRAIVESVEKIFAAAKVNYAVLSQELQSGAELYELGFTDKARKAAEVLRKRSTA